MTSSGTEAAMTAHPPRARRHRPRARSSSSPAPTTATSTGCSRRPAPASPRRRCRPAPACPASAGGGHDRRALERPRRAASRPPSAHELAAIIAEPLPANMGLVPPRDGLPRAAARARRRQRRAARPRRGHQRLPRRPRRRAGAARACSGDLTIMGKVIGGGLPAAAVGGRAELMRHARARRRRLPGGHAVGQPAGGRRRPRHARAARRARLPAPGGHHRAPRRGPARRGRAAATRCRSSACPGLLTVFFSRAPGRLFEDARACDLDAYAAWCRELLARGVYPPPSQFEAWFPSLAHTRRAARAHARGRRRRLRRACPSRAPRDERRWTPRDERGRSGAPARAAARGGRADGHAARACRRRGMPARRARAPRSSPRAARARTAAATEYELLIEAIYEGYLLHYGTPRVVRAPEADLRAARGRPALRARPRAARRARRHRRRGRARRHDHAQRARPGRRRRASSPRRCGRRARGPSAGVRARPTAAPRSSLLAGAPGAIEAMRTSAAAAPASP